MRKARTIGLTAGASALTAGFLAAMTTAAPAATVSQAAPTVHVKPGVNILKANASATPWTYSLCESELGIACYQPTDLQAAYNEGPLFAKGITGKGSTIVIVDSLGSPTIQNDLSVFDQQYGFPAPPSFKIVAPVGAPNPSNTDWAGETTLDVEYAHTIAPGANIVLVETPDEETEGTVGMPSIVKAEEDVLDHPAKYGITGKVTVISQSFGATEPTFTSYQQLAPLRAAYEDAAKKGVTVLAATGDAGATDYQSDGTDLFTTQATDWPSTDPLVTAVGGTQIRESSSGKFSQVVWNDTYDVPLQEAFTGTAGPNAFATGGGVSQFFSLPGYQASVAGKIAAAIHAKPRSVLPRAVPDISMSGACDGAVTYYSSYPGTPAGWHLVCGTSEATPLFSGIVALAAQVAHHPLGLVNPKLYQLSAEHAPGLVDITSGNNTVTFTQGDPAQEFTVQGYSAGRGYDLASGVGTVNAALFVPELAGLR